MGSSRPPDRGHRRLSITGTLSVSGQPKLETIMRIGEDHDAEQPDGALLLGEDIEPPLVVNVEESDQPLGRHSSIEKKTLFWMSEGAQDGSVLALICTGASRNLISQ